MSFFTLSDRSSWQAFWAQSAGNSRLYEESFSLFNKRLFSTQQGQANSSVPQYPTKWAPHTVALPSWARLH
ncbi:MAG: hypothetical protein EBT28_11155 [Betaproteobacteria bacterium]|jgi:hypothetical protein|nr:hypothetical protein [Betaproteobacteria bacterium]